jgi:hypothetical protein
MRSRQQQHAHNKQQRIHVRETTNLLQNRAVVLQLKLLVKVMQPGLVLLLGQFRKRR